MSKYIIISGVDGSGKTSIIEEVKAQLEAEGHSVGYIWMRYNHRLVKVMHAIAKVIGLSRKEDTEMGRMWLHRFYKNRAFCKLYIWCSYIDNWMVRKKPMLLGTNYVICDRWVNDIIIDMGAECHKKNILDSKWYHRYQALLPKDCCQFVVMRDKEKVLQCRAENRFNEAFAYRYDLYQELAKKDNITLVDNTGTIKDSVRQVFDNLKK